MRPSKDETWLKVAAVIAWRGTCARRKVGCVLVDISGDVLSTGYNGVARGLTHCIDTPCGGQTYSSGEGLEQCHAIHAEQNALMQCRDVQAIHICYLTISPCLHCVKMLMNTGCKKIVFLDNYANSKEAQLIWQGNNIGTPKYEKTNRLWFHYTPPHPREFGNISW